MTPRLPQFTTEPEFSALKRGIVARFAGQTTTVAAIEEFVLADTPFRETHYKKRLAELEREGIVAPVDAKPGRRAGTCGDADMQLRFSEPREETT